MKNEEATGKVWSLSWRLDSPNEIIKDSAITYSVFAFLVRLYAPWKQGPFLSFIQVHAWQSFRICGHRREQDT